MAGGHSGEIRAAHGGPAPSNDRRYVDHTITFVSIHPTRTDAAILRISPGNAINPDMLDPIYLPRRQQFDQPGALTNARH